MEFYMTPYQVKYHKVPYLAPRALAHCKLALLAAYIARRCNLTCNYCTSVQALDLWRRNPLL